MIKVKRALISVSDKTGLLDFAKGLQAMGVEIISTGGTAKLLRSAGLSVQEISDYTGFPEILDGRVKTLHPMVHGGLLALRDKKDHMDQLKKHHIGLIDMVVVNLYPFEKVIRKKNVALEEAIENIDIGGPSMLRSAAKNYKSVAVICNPQRYGEILKELDTNSGLLSDRVLTSLAVEVFQRTAQYDSVINDFLSARFTSGDFSGLPKDLNPRFTKRLDLRYGENPHQAAAFYTSLSGKCGLACIKQLHGKELSFNNLLDLNAALEVIMDFDRPAAVVIKHNNPTGVAQAGKLSEAYDLAHKCDPLSAFGGIIGLNRKVDLATAERIGKSGFMECILAPSYASGALRLLTKKKNLRIIELKPEDMRSGAHDLKKVSGGVLYQEKDRLSVSEKDLRVATKVKPTKAQLESMLFGWKVIKHIRSNAIILVKGQKTVGIGCGQTSRVEAAALAIKKAGRLAKGSVLVSDAFIPKTDNIQLAAKAGIKAVIQTGGSIADEDVIRAADRARIAMVMTGVRHFKH